METPYQEKYPLLLNLEEFKNTFLADFQDWRDNYLDDLPDHLLEPGEPNYHKYKCRTNWFNIFEKTLLIAVPLLEEPLYSEVIHYVEEIFPLLNWNIWRTKKDIDTANEILHKVTTWLEQA